LAPGRTETLRDACRMRRTGVYVLLCTGDEPTRLGVFGFADD
jgi:hypothetical protein